MRFSKICEGGSEEASPQLVQGVVQANGPVVFQESREATFVQKNCVRELGV